MCWNRPGWTCPSDPCSCKKVDSSLALCVLLPSGLFLTLSICGSVSVSVVALFLLTGKSFSHMKDVFSLSF